MFRDKITTVMLLFFMCFQAHGVDKAQVLPKQVNYAALRYGVMNHLGEIYGPTGGISFRGDSLSQNFDLAKIKRFADLETKADLDRMVKTLNTFGKNEIASQLSLGTLKFEVDPSIRYTAPIFARGLTDRFTLGLAVPIINYKTELNISQVGSNVPQIKQEMNAIIESSEELRKGLNRLDESLVNTFAKVVNDRGYKAIRSREETFLGDVQLVGLYHLVREARENMVIKTGVILPTGPQDDPDDLTDLDNQHQLALGAGVVNDYTFANGWTLGAGMYALSRLPDRSTQRVPESEDESLPGLERKEALQRDLGDSLSANTNVRYQFNDYFEAALGYEIGTKGTDSYKGGQAWDYSLLSKNTYQTWNKSVVAVEYSTVTGFMKGRDPLPLSVSYDFSDIFAGSNMERQQIHEFSIKMFF